jgi:hypothetical protein
LILNQDSMPSDIKTVSIKTVSQLAFFLPPTPTSFIALRRFIIFLPKQGIAFAPFAVAGERLETEKKKKVQVRLPTAIAYTPEQGAAVALGAARERLHRRA